MNIFKKNLLIALFFLSVPFFASAETVFYQSSQTGGPVAIGGPLVNGISQKFTATSSFSLSSFVLSLATSTNSADGCLHAYIYSDVGGLPNTSFFDTQTCTDDEDLTSTVQDIEWFTPDIQIPAGYVFHLVLLYEGSSAICTNNCFTVSYGTGDPYEANTNYYLIGGVWTNEGNGGANANLYFKLNGDFAPPEQEIRIIAPADGATITGGATTTTVEYENPNGFSQISFCEYIPNTTVGGGSDCVNGGQAMAIGESGQVQFLTSASATGTKILSVAFGTPLSERFTGVGTRYIDWDSVAVGFNETPIVTVGDSYYGQLGRATSSTATLFNCETFDFGCYLKDAFTWAFYPSVSIQLIDETEDIDEKIVFAYVSDIKDIFLASDDATSTIGDLNISYGVMGVSTGTIMFLDISDIESSATDIFARIRAIIVAVLWAMYLLALWRLFRMFFKLFASTT